jgi:hypothetical protein
MELFRWFSHNIAGWHTLVPAVIAFVIAATILERRGRTSSIPLAYFACWAASMAMGYVDAGVGRFLERNASLWAAMCLTLVLITLIPVTIAQLGATSLRASRLRHYRWLVGGMLALVLLPVTNIVSRLIGNFLLPRVNAG